MALFETHMIVSQMEVSQMEAKTGLSRG